MSRFVAYRRPVLLLLSFVALLFSANAFAYTIKGGCEWFRGQCLIPMKPILTPEEAAQVNRPFTMAEKPIELIEYDLRTKVEKRRPLSIEELQAANTLMESQGAFKAAPKALTVIDKPWNDPVLKSIVKLVMTFGQYMAACSGTLVGKHTVLTAGHCVYAHADPREGFNFTGYAGSITAYVEYANGDSPFAGVTAVSLAAPSNWANNEDFRSDLGIIQLETDVGVPAGYQTASGNARQATFTYAGYPGTDGYDGSDLAEGTATPTTVNSYNVCHRNTLIQGQSGGPGWHPDDASITIVAVNSYSSGSTNCSCRVQSWALTQINTYEAKTADPAANYWTCDFDKWATGEACDCECGIYDADCKNSTLPVHGCAEGESCEFPGKCVCEKKCTGRRCGPDGCGGNCGTCSGATPTCLEDTGTCIGCDTNHPCEANYLCLRGICQLNCPVVCEGRQCTSVGECVCGTCGENATCNETTFQCDANPTTDGDTTPTDGDTTPADGDTTPVDGDTDTAACSGTCELSEPSFCLSQASLCSCEIGIWVASNCQAQCAARGLVANGCGKNAIDENVCFCAVGTVDGDTDGIVPQDGSSGGGCQSAAGVAGMGLLGLFLALVAWRKKQLPN